MATTIPPGGQIPVEPPKLPPANPGERDALRKMIADNKWDDWVYDAVSPAGPIYRVTLIDEGMLNATLSGVPYAWPMPSMLVTGVTQRPPSNCSVVVFRPGERMGT